MSGTTLEIVRAGLHTTVQDAGRWGYQHLGVPVGGALDLDALRRANALVGNSPNEAALEVTLTGCALRTTGDVVVAVTGARFLLGVHPPPAGSTARPFDVTPIANDTAVLLPRGTTLVLGERQAGARAYVAVRGGLDTPVTLGSRSAWPLLPRRGALQAGDVLPVGDRAVAPASRDSLPGPAHRDVLRVLPAPESARFPMALQSLCDAGGYRVAASASRMAYPLEDGPAVPMRAPDRASSGTVTGAIQVLPSGMPVVLMAERQTTGGYPVAAVVIAADLPHAAQLAPGARVRFTRCSRVEALRALMAVGASEGM